MGAERRLRTLLVGMGKMGRNHFRVISEDPRFELVGVVDTALSEVPGGKVPLLRSADEAKDWDAAVVAVPTTQHYDVVEKLLPSGKAILVEKPIASDPEQGKRLLTGAKKHGAKLAVGHVERFNPAIRKLKELLSTEWMGRPIHFSFTRVGGYPSAIDPHHNVLLDLAVHDLDIMGFLTGPISVRSSVAHSTWKKGTFDTAEILVSSESGVSGALHVNWVTPTKIRTLRVTGTQGVCFVDYILQTVTLMGGSLLQRKFSSQFNFDRIVEEYRSSDKVEFGIVKEEPLKAQLGEFHKFATGKPSGICTAEEGQRALELAHDAIRTAAAGVQHT